MASQLSLLLVIALGMTFYAAPILAQSVGNCEPGVATKDLDVGNVRAAMFTNGNLFWQEGGFPAWYEVPKNGGVNAIFASSLWVGGLVDGELRLAASTYNRYKFWPGPISDDGSGPVNCSPYDRIWKVSQSDLVALDSSGIASVDLMEWPTGLGAPTLSPRNADGSQTDADGIDNDDDGFSDEPGEMRSITDEILAQPLLQRQDRTINLSAGERPDLLGDQMLWWVMNDAGGRHVFSDGTTTDDTDPIGLEVLASAFAFDAPGDLGNATFYRYRIRYKGRSTLENAYVAMHSDPDLGAAYDDYVSSDSTFGLGIVFNADNDDDGEYGIGPPAVGYDFLIGPSVDAPGDSARTIGGLLSDRRTLAMTSFLFFWGGGAGIPYSDPRLIRDYYRNMQGLWKDGTRMRVGGDGYNTPETETTTFMYSGRAEDGAFWSEYNTDRRGTPNTPAERRFVIGSGPFTMEPDDEQDILVGIIWARGVSNLDSYVKLKSVDQKIQRFVDSGFPQLEGPAAPDLVASESDRAVTLTWTNPDSSNNVLDSFHEYAPLANLDDPYYDLEGYEVWQFDTEDASWPDCVEQKLCRLLQVFDRANGVTEIRGDDDADGFVEVYAQGTDSGIRHAFSLQGLTNYRTYYFGVRAYAYNGDAVPTIIRSPFSRVAAVPSRSSLTASAAAIAALSDSSEFDIVADFSGTGDGFFAANVVDPLRTRSCNYRVEFYEVAAGTTYDIRCGEETVVDGSSGVGVYGENISVVDGLEYTTRNSAAGIKYFTVVSNAAGALDPPEMGSFAFNSNGYPTFEGSDRPNPARQQTNGSTWGFHHGGGSDNTYNTFLARVLRGDNLEHVGIYDYELRFTEEGGLARRQFDDGLDMAVPFELWRTGIATPDDPSDDVRLIPYVCEEACGAGAVSGTFDITGDSGVSGGDDDPFSDWIYWNLPLDETPGDSGYQQFFGSGVEAGAELFARTILVNWNGGSAPPYDADLPETGTIFRITTRKPLQPGDVFTFSTVGLEPTAPEQSEKIARLEDIGIVPNPYRGTSRYETSTQKDEVRFTNLPDETTIRVFTLNGRLVRTIYKNLPGQGWLSWDVRTDAGRPLASGIYLVHVEVPGVGTHVIKFGYVGKRWGD